MWHVTSWTKIMKKIYQNITNKEQNTIVDKKPITIYLNLTICVYLNWTDFITLLLDMLKNNHFLVFRIISKSLLLSSLNRLQKKLEFWGCISHRFKLRRKDFFEFKTWKKLQSSWYNLPKSNIYSILKPGKNWE